VNRGLTTGLPHTLVALPVIVSLVFCFSFVLMTDKPDSSHTSSHSSPLTAKPPASLPTIQLHEETPLPIVSPGSNASLGGAFDSLNTTSPQPGNGYGRTNPQTQTNGQAANNSQSLLNGFNGIFNGNKN